MATSTYSSRSLLPWQSPFIAYSIAAEHYVLQLCSARGKPSHELVLWRSERTGRWFWGIKSLTTGYWLAECKRGGYVRPQLAERYMLRRLHELLHPKSNLPASLPPQGGAISAARRGR